MYKYIFIACIFPQWPKCNKQTGDYVETQGIKMLSTIMT
jgi:hypothetical protein